MYKLTKIEDTMFGGNHPNNHNIGKVTTGTVIENPVVGKSFYIYTKLSRYTRTSQVTKVLEDGIFHTKNSIYKLEKID